METTPEDIAERKMRERLAFLQLPPKEAQRMISFSAIGPIEDVTPPGEGMLSSLADDFMEDGALDE